MTEGKFALCVQILFILPPESEPAYNMRIQKGKNKNKNKNKNGKKIGNNCRFIKNIKLTLDLLHVCFL